jgi:DNA-binding response OmpR family regulator/HPt (histidine-containing phosphotransfer) domain-containing protein
VTPRILVVDDDQMQVDVVSYLLGRAGFEPIAALEPGAAVRLFREEPPALVILDVQIGTPDGLDLLQQFKRERPELPILLLTVLNAEDDRVRGLELGADDYLTKPFGYRELIARVRAMLRRGYTSRNKPMLPRRIQLGAVTLDPMLHEVTRDGAPVDLSPTEFRLLQALMEHPNTLVSTRTLLQEVWGHQDMTARNVLRVTTSRLRSKLEPDPAVPRYLQTVPGEGLLFRADSPKPSRAAEPTEGPVALEVIAELRELLGESGDRSLEQLNQVFVGSAEAHLGAIRRALAGQDAETVAREAHRLRGNTGSLGAQRMSNLCGLIEERARAGDLTRVPGLLERLERELATYQDAVRPMLRP